MVQGRHLNNAVWQRLLTLYYATCAFLVCWQWMIPAQLADPDLWGRLSVAALWFRNGEFPYRDVFSFTAFHHRWIDHEWLSGVVFYLALWLGGEIGLHVLKYGMIFAMFYLLFSECRRTFPKNISPQNTRLPVFVFAGLALLFPLYGDAFLPTIRAQIFSFLFFINFLWILERVRRNTTPDSIPQDKKHGLLWWLIPLGVIWANAHGGFILGIILLILYGVGEWLGSGAFKAAKPYFLVALALVLAIAVLNPYGFDYWPFILHALTMPRPFISEWNPLPFLTLDFWPLKLLMLIVVSALGMLCWKAFRAKQPDENRSALICTLLVLLFLMGLAIKGVRFKTFFTLGVLFYLPLLVALCQKAPNKTEAIPAAAQSADKRQPSWLATLPGLAAGGAVAIILTLFPPTFYARTIVQTGEYAQSQGLVPFPVSMMQFLKESPYRGNLINPFPWGEFLAWTLYPRFKVAWDGRYEEVYQKPEMDFFTEFYALPHQSNPQRIWEMADRSAGDFILIERISPNQSLVAQNPSWQLLATDDFYFLYGRKSSLKRLPPYHPPSTSDSPKTFYTIGDFFLPADLERFKIP